MDSRSIVIAGSSGFLGTHLSAALVARGHRVTALVRKPDLGPRRVHLGPLRTASTTAR